LRARISRAEKQVDETLVSRLLARAALHPDHPAIVDETRSVSYGEFAARVRSAAVRLSEAGLRAGETLALSCPASEKELAELAAALYAAGHLGAAVLPLHPDVPSGRRRELTALFKARFAVVTRPEDLGVPSLAARELCAMLHTAVELPARADAPNAPFLYQFSSGTSGRPKAVLLTHYQTHAFALSLVGRYGWRHTDRLVPAMPAPSKVGMRYLMRILFAGGALLNLPFPASRAALADLIVRFGATAAGVSPAQLRLLLASPAAGNPAPQLSFLESIGASIAPAEVEAARRAITPWLHINYGATEIGLIATLLPTDSAGTGYSLVDGVRVQIVDAAGTLLPTGVTGAIRLQTPWMADGYFDHPAETARRFRNGWFYPGDAGLLDTDGRLHVRGREDGVINRGGVKVVPEDVEAQLLAHPGVADAVVTSVPDTTTGEVPVAFVVLRPGTTLEMLKAYCAEHIDASSIPALILSLERMPRSADGKVLRAALKEHARSYAHMLHSR
jgi:acyl-CoA synthetase (AMP-forming)/AMP-acid ligase II